LWLVGDLVNRGPESLATLRFVRDLGAAACVVLGNHDLHFLAIYYGGHLPRRADTLKELLAAPDVDELAAWLRQQPLVWDGVAEGWLMVHAGVPPDWSLTDTLARAGEAHALYTGEQGPEFFRQMYGDQPARWHNSLQGLARARCIVNYLTRMRMIDAQGTLEFQHKGLPMDAPKTHRPWFAYKRAIKFERSIVFGHWAALEGHTGLANVVALDTGCVWGQRLTSLCLETGRLRAVSARS